MCEVAIDRPVIAELQNCIIIIIIINIVIFTTAITTTKSKLYSV